MEGIESKGKSGTLEESGSYTIPAALADNPGFLLNRSARLIRDKNTEALKPTGLTVRDLGLLRVIASEGPLTQQALSERHKTDRSTIVDVIDGLEKRQLVMRSANPRDRRSYLLMITPRGKKLLAAANKLTLKEKQKFLEALNEDEWHVLRELLARLINFHDRPEVKPEVKPESVKPVVKPESNSYGELESKSARKSARKSEGKPQSKSDSESDSKFESNETG